MIITSIDIGRVGQYWNTMLRSAEPPAPPPLSDALLALGYEPAANSDYDFLHAYPDARPLLSALCVSFTPACVLTEAEAHHYRRLQSATPPPLPHEDACAAAAPLLSSSSPPLQVLHARRALRRALRNRLNALRAQTAVLSDILSQSSSADPNALHRDSSHQHEDTHLQHSPSTAFHAVDHFQTSLQQMSHHIAQLRPPPNLFSPSNPLSQYISAERRECAAITSAPTAYFNAQGANRHFLTQPLAAPAPTKKPSSQTDLSAIIDSYAQLRANLVYTRAAALRTHLLKTNLSTRQDPTDLVNASPLPTLTALIADVHSRVTAALSQLSDVVTASARAWLTDRVHIRRLSRLHRRQRRYISLLHRSVAQLVDARLRVLCIWTTQSHTSQQFDDLEHSLSSLERHGLALTSVKPQPQLLSSQSLSDDDLHLQDEDSCQGHDQTISSCPNDQHTIAYSSAFEEANHVLATLRQRIGCSRSWLDLDINPTIASSIHTLEQEISSNTVVLEATLRNLHRIHERSKSSAVNREWVHRVNAAPQNHS